MNIAELPEKNTFEAYASKRVSFIIVTKNRAEYLQKVLEQHLELIKPDDELIIIDGGSADNTHDIVERYANQVDIFISEPDISPGHALSKGMLLSRGKYIKCSTDDDVTYPEAMEQAIQVMEEHPEVDLLLCGGTRQRDTQLSYFYIPHGVNYGKQAKSVLKYGACGVGLIVRRSALSKVGLFHPTHLVSDKEFVLRAISRGANVKFCRINLFNHPIHSDSLTVRKQRQFQTAGINLFKEYDSPGSYYWHRLGKWRSLRFIPWLLQHPRIYRLAKTLLDIVRKLAGRKKTEAVIAQQQENALPGDKGFLWDGGFS